MSVLTDGQGCPSYGFADGGYAVRWRVRGVSGEPSRAVLLRWWNVPLGSRHLLPGKVKRAVSRDGLRSPYLGDILLRFTAD
jgi:hypothetical protein